MGRRAYCANTCADAKGTLGMDDKVLGLQGCAAPAFDPGRVTAARRRLLPHEEAQRLSELFRLLGDPTRVRLLYALAEVGELCVCDLAATVEAPETTVSHALRLLRSAGIVRNRRAGRMIYYSLDDAHVRILLDLSAEHLRHANAGAGEGLTSPATPGSSEATVAAPSGGKRRRRRASDAQQPATPTTATRRRRGAVD